MSDYVPRADLALIPPWTEKCNRIDTVKSKHLLGRRKATTKDGSPRLTWLLDNGSTCHIADELEVLPYCFNIREETTVIKAVKDTAVATSYRRADMAMSFVVKSPDGPRTGVVLLSDMVLLRRPQDDYVLCNARSCPKGTPEAKKPVFIASQAQLERDGITFLYGRAERVMILPNDLKVPITPRGDQYYLESATCMKRGEDVRLRVEAQVPKYHWEVWHRRMGHVSRELLKQIEATCTGIRIDQRSWGACDGCAHCKAGNMLTWKNEDLEIRDRKVYAPMEDIISDYQGPFRILSLVHGHSGVCWFMDRRTKLTGAFPVKSKSEALEQLKIFIASCRALQDSFSGTSYKLHVSPRLVSSDQGGEQMGGEWDSYARTNGITRVFSGTGEHHETALLDRKIRTVSDRTRVALHACYDLLNLWAVCVIYMNYLENRTGSSSTGVSPITSLTKRPGDLRHIRVFGCDVLYLEPRNGALRKVGGKWARKGWPGIFCGISSRIRGYLIYSLERRDFVHVRRVVTNEESFRHSQQLAGYHLTRLNMSTMILDEDENLDLGTLLSGNPFTRQGAEQLRHNATEVDLTHPTNGSNIPVAHGMQAALPNRPHSHEAPTTNEVEASHDVSRADWSQEEREVGLLPVRFHTGTPVPDTPEAEDQEPGPQAGDRTQPIDAGGVLPSVVPSEADADKFRVLVFKLTRRTYT